MQVGGNQEEFLAFVETIPNKNITQNFVEFVKREYCLPLPQEEKTISEWAKAAGSRNGDYDNIVDAVLDWLNY